MSQRGEAERNDANHSASAKEDARDGARKREGASSASTAAGNATGEGTGLIEQMIDTGNLNLAWRKVKANKGAAGVDGLDIEETAAKLRTNRRQIETQLLAGNYTPLPVRRVEIEKASGGTRKLGAPTVTDRWIQQAMLQVLTPLFETGFSERSYGFRPGRSAHQAVLAAREHQRHGKRWVVDIDLASFFDEVNHDLLIAGVRRKVKDERVIKLIRAYLNAGVMLGGLVEASGKGAPQGGSLSPLLSNILLDRLDKELEKRGHDFCRYADDCNIYVRTKRSAQRVMASVIDYLEKKLKVKVNETKSAVDRPWKRIFLGYSFTAHHHTKIRVPEHTCRKMRAKLKESFRRGQGRNLGRLIREELNPKLRGWMNYFRLSETKGFAEELDQWVRRRLRQIIWKQWKRPATRYRKMREAGLEEKRARQSASNGRGSWHNSGASHMHAAIPSKAFEQMGLVKMLEILKSAQLRPTLSEPPDA